MRIHRGKWRTGLVIMISLLSNVVTASEKEKVLVEHIFASSASDVWSKIGQFCSIKHWQSLVEECFIEQRSDGIYRVVVMNNNDAFVERLESYSNDEMSIKYSITKGPLELKNYRSKLKLFSEGENKTRLEWRAWYDNIGLAKEGEMPMSEVLEGLFENGIKGMDALL